MTDEELTENGRQASLGAHDAIAATQFAHREYGLGYHVTGDSPGHPDIAEAFRRSRERMAAEALDPSLRARRVKASWSARVTRTLRRWLAHALYPEYLEDEW